MCLRSICLGGSAVCSLLVALQGVMSTAAQAEGDIRNALPFSNLELGLRLIKTDYVVGEPIAVYGRLTNPYPRPVNGYDCWGWFHRGGTRWQGGEVWLYVELLRDGKALDVNGPYGMAQPGKQAPRPSLIPARAVRRAKQLIVYGHKDVDRFLAPGTLEATAKLRSLSTPGESVASKRVRISIHAPQGRDSEAFEWLSQRDLFPYLGYLLFLRTSLNDQRSASLKAFLEQYADTVYAPYARFSLGQMDFYRGRYDEAIEHFNRVMLRGDLPLAEDARYLAAECNRILLRPLEADHALRLLIEQYPDTPAAEDAKLLRHHLWGVPLRQQQKEDRRGRKGGRKGDITDIDSPGDDNQ